jgi:hypothetical protein
MHSHSHTHRHKTTCVETMIAALTTKKTKLTVRKLSYT